MKMKLPITEQFLHENFENLRIEWSLSGKDIHAEIIGPKKDWIGWLDHIASAEERGVFHPEEATIEYNFRETLADFPDLP